MADDYGLGAMASIIPVVVVGGVAMKFAEHMFPQQERLQPRGPRVVRRVTRRARYTKRPNLGIVGFGNFKNIGF